MTSPLTLLKSAFDALARVRESQAERYVAGVLLSYDDETLRAHGYSRAALRKRAGPHFF